MVISISVVIVERNGVVEADEVEHELLVLLDVAQVNDGVLPEKDEPFYF